MSKRVLIGIADVALCHLEISRSGSRSAGGYPRFNTPPSFASAITSTGCDACSTASNHSADLSQVTPLSR